MLMHLPVPFCHLLTYGAVLCPMPNIISCSRLEYTKVCTVLLVKIQANAVIEFCLLKNLSPSLLQIYKQKCTHKYLVRKITKRLTNKNRL